MEEKRICFMYGEKFASPILDEETTFEDLTVQQAKTQILSNLITSMGLKNEPDLTTFLEYYKPLYCTPTYCQTNIQSREEICQVCNISKCEDCFSGSIDAINCATHKPSCTQSKLSDFMCFFNKQFVGAWNFHMVIDTKVLCKHGPCSNCGVKHMQPSELKSYDIVLRDILFNMKPTTVTVHMDEFRKSHRKGCAKLIIPDIQDSVKAGYTIRLKKALISSCITAPLSNPGYLSDIYDLKLETVRKLCADTRNAVKKRKTALRSSVIIRSYFSVADTSGHTFFFVQSENTQQELVGIYTKEEVDTLSHLLSQPLWLEDLEMLSPLPKALIYDLCATTYNHHVAAPILYAETLLFLIDLWRKKKFPPQFDIHLYLDFSYDTYGIEALLETIDSFNLSKQDKQKLQTLKQDWKYVKNHLHYDEFNQYHPQPKALELANQTVEAFEAALNQNPTLEFEVARDTLLFFNQAVLPMRKTEGQNFRKVTPVFDKRGNIDCKKIRHIGIRSNCAILLLQTDLLSSCENKLPNCEYGDATAIAHNRGDVYLNFEDQYMELD